MHETSSPELHTKTDERNKIKGIVEEDTQFYNNSCFIAPTIELNGGNSLGGLSSE